MTEAEQYADLINEVYGPALTESWNLVDLAEKMIGDIKTVTTDGQGSWGIEFIDGSKCVAKFGPCRLVLDKQRISSVEREDTV